MEGFGLEFGLRSTVLSRVRTTNFMIFVLDRDMKGGLQMPETVGEDATIRKRLRGRGIECCFYLVGEKNSLLLIHTGGLNPRVACEIDRPADEPFEHYALEEELPLVLVHHRDGPRRSEVRGDHEFRRVLHLLGFDVRLLEPVLQRPFAAPLSRSGICSSSPPNENQNR